MPNSFYEIEIKSLLGDRETAERLKERMRELDTSSRLVRKEKQRNHYFIEGALDVLAEKAASFIEKERGEQLRGVVERAREYSVRTREAILELAHPDSERQKLSDEVLLVVKASVDDTTSENGIARLEVSGVSELPLEKLDELVLGSGFSYQAKWSREREEYEYKGITVCLDKNAGYGYLAEFEVVETDASRAEGTKERLRTLMRELGAEELPQARLERMFAYYNEHWPEYYGTDKTFVVK